MAVVPKKKTPAPYQVPSFETVMVKLPMPLPKGLQVVYVKEEHRYTLAATSKQGIKALCDLAFSGALH